MSLLPLLGHAALRARLAGAMARGTLPGALLLAGPRGVGKQRLALWLAQALVCATDVAARPDGEPCGRCQACHYAAPLTHPDLHWLFPRPRLKDGDASPEDVRQDLGEAIAERVRGGGLWSGAEGTEGLFVATVRALVQAAAMSPALGRRKVFVVGDAERLVPQEGADAAANAFLKLLEEPPADTTLILTSSEPGALLPTIRSRVVMARVAPLAPAEVAAWLALETEVEGAKGGPRRVTVQALLAEQGVVGDAASLVDRAAGAPGALVGGGSAGAALAEAERLLRAAMEGTRAERMRAAFGQGASRARGAYADVLDGLTVQLHAVARRDATRNPERALAASRGMDVVERAKRRAQGNVSPQLVTAQLLRELRGLFR